MGNAKRRGVAVAPKPCQAPATRTAGGSSGKDTVAQPRPAHDGRAALTLMFRLDLDPGLSVESLVEILRQLPASATVVWGR